METSSKVKEEVLSFLKRNNTAVIATIQKGKPQASTIHYIVDDEWNIYFLTHRNTSKYVNISSNEQVAVVVGTGPKHITVQAMGIAIICAGEEMKRISRQFETLKESPSLQHWPVNEMAKFRDKNPVVFKFEPIELSFMNLDDDDYPYSKSVGYYHVM